MPSLDLLMPFMIATVVFAVVPGPGMLYAASQTIARGRRAGWMSALGMHIAGYGHILAAAAGLAVVLETVPVLHTLIRFAGAAYLVWLGATLALSAGFSPPPAARAAGQGRRALGDAVAVELMNPKSVMFFFAFLPQFTDPSAALPVWAQMLVLGAVVNLVFSASDALCVLLSDAAARIAAASGAARRWTRRIGGGVLVALGTHLAMSRQ